MSFFKRISATVSANLDRAISQIENHDAVAEVALEEVREALARLTVQRNRVRTEASRHADRAAVLEREAATWADRARRIGHEDEQRAMDCLARRRACQSEAGSLARRAARQQALEERLDRDITALRDRLVEIESRREDLKGRELSARGSQAALGLDQSGDLDVDRVFERWEVDVTRAELRTPAELPADTLGSEFEQSEREQSLRDELSALLADEEPVGSHSEEEAR